MGKLAATREGLPKRLIDATLGTREKIAALGEVEGLTEMYEAYLVEFGDRCLEELKLESPTVGDDPESLLVSIGATGFRGNATREAVPTEVVVEPGSRLKKYVFRKVLKATRDRVRDRENLRFERTRLFGRVRRIVRELGGRLHANGELADPADVFHLELDELLGLWEGNRTAGPIAALVMVRKQEFERCLEAPAPPDRLETRGPLHLHLRFPEPRPPETVGGATRRGVGACPGVVRGKVRVVEDPRGARVEPGEILVARQTDPGWVVLFPCAAGLLVERGSVLSHSAIVSRELGLPCVVSLPGVMDWLNTGDEVEMDGASGTVTRIGDE